MKLTHLKVRKQSKEYRISSNTVTTSEDKIKHHGEAPQCYMGKKKTQNISESPKNTNSVSRSDFVLAKIHNVL